ncbi:MAG TPA: dipeptidyl peptidase 3 [Planctomycetota bacterium]|nr:dipeptidyl peptidase 3 [Planctomycetota bacterium]
MQCHFMIPCVLFLMSTFITSTCPSQSDILKVHRTPDSLPVRVLDCTASFEGLSPSERLYAHWMTEASWRGALIAFEQVSTESPRILDFLMRLYSKDALALRRAATRRRVTDAELLALDVYAARFLSNTGNYLSFGDTKFIPSIPVDRLSVVVDAAANLTIERDLDLLALWDDVALPMYSLEASERALGLPPKGSSAYYASSITEEQVDFVGRALTAMGIEAWNTRVFLDPDGMLVVRVASVEERSAVESFENRPIRFEYGDFSYHLSRVNDALRRAIHYSANDHQRQMIRKYIEHFTTGAIQAHKESQRFWVQDKGPVVETNLGFIETYRDPMSVRAEWEGLVAVVDKEQSKSFQRLVSRGGELVKRMPWGAAFEKDTFQEPDFTSLNVLAFANGGIPSGINIPNYDDIRMNHGFKNVSLGNVILAGDASAERVDFIADADQDLYKRLQTQAFKVQVGLHELLGHGSGKLLSMDADGKRNFEPSTVDPTTNKPVATFYRPGETWGSVFGKIASTYEECRAEAVGLHLCVEKDILKLFGHEGEEAEDVIYVNWLAMARAGVASLSFYNPDTKVWGQAHMQGRFALLQVMLEAGNGFLSLEKTASGDTVVQMDRKKIMNVGHPAVAKFLEKLHVLKCTANAAAGQALYEHYTTVDAPMLALRDYVESNRKPRHIWVQPVTDLDATGAAYLRTYPGTYRGVIDSFLDRYREE